MLKQKLAQVKLMLKHPTKYLFRRTEKKGGGISYKLLDRKMFGNKKLADIKKDPKLSKPNLGSLYEFDLVPDFKSEEAFLKAKFGAPSSLAEEKEEK